MSMTKKFMCACLVKSRNEETRNHRSEEVGTSVLLVEGVSFDVVTSGVAISSYRHRGTLVD